MRAKKIDFLDPSDHVKLMQTVKLGGWCQGFLPKSAWTLYLYGISRIGWRSAVHVANVYGRARWRRQKDRGRGGGGVRDSEEWNDRRNRHSNRDTTLKRTSEHSLLLLVAADYRCRSLREREIDDRETKRQKGREGEKVREQSRIDRVARGVEHHRPTIWSACLPYEPDKKWSVPKDEKANKRRLRDRTSEGDKNLRKNQEGEANMECNTSKKNIR